MQKFEQLVEIIGQARNDHDKFESGNASAGTRLRQAMLEVKKLAQEVRVTVQEVKNSK